MSHELIRRATGRSRTYHDSPSRFYASLNSWLRDYDGITMQEFLDAASEVRKQIDAGPSDLHELAELVADWNDLITLAQRAGGSSIPVFAVVSTYDPQGSFRPGERVSWSGHFTREEAERVLPLWEAHLNRPRDPMTVEEDWPVELHAIRRDGWEGPRR